jgi:endo-1,4-beta-xylanase
MGIGKSFYAKPGWWSAFLVCVFALTSNAQTLRVAADRASVLIGTAVRPSQFSEKQYASVLAREFNLVEPEDAMKSWVLRPTRHTYDFRAGDQVVRFAKTHQMKVRGHCLVWGRDNPDWLIQQHFTSRQLSSLLHDHISRVMRHYDSQVFAWDVVNETLDEDGRLRDSIWYNQPGIGLAANGTAYIEQVFRWAHKADPHALLFYNEAEAEALNRKSDAMYAIVKDFKRRGVPMDGIGLQMHLSIADADLGSMTTSMSANIARFSALGVQVHITELDVSVPVDSSGTASPEDLKRQADVYRGVVSACLQNPGCTAIQTWGFTDRYSWIRSHSRGTRGQALLFNRDYEPKPSYWAVLRALLFEEVLRRPSQLHPSK